MSSIVVIICMFSIFQFSFIAWKISMLISRWAIVCQSPEKRNKFVYDTVWLPCWPGCALAIHIFVFATASFVFIACCLSLSLSASSNCHESCLLVIYHARRVADLIGKFDEQCVGHTDSLMELFIARIESNNPYSVSLKFMLEILKISLSLSLSLSVYLPFAVL